MVPDGAVNDPSFMVKLPDIVRVELEAVAEPPVRVKLPTVIEAGAVKEPPDCE